MVEELRVLLGVQHLEEGTGWVTVVPSSDLVDLVDEDEGVLSLDLLERLDDLSGHRSDVSEGE